MKFAKNALMRSAGALIVLTATLHAASSPQGYFEPNLGQTRSASSAPFLARTSSGLAAVLPDRLAIRSKANSIIGVELEKANPHAHGACVDELPGVSHYALDRDPTKWIYGVHHFAAVRYKSVYPGIDLRYHVSSGNLEFDLDAENPSKIREIRLKFSEDIRLGPSGDLVLADGSIRRPEAWQTLSGIRRPVAVSFRITGRRRAVFEVAAIDPNAPIVIDPMIDFATYLGGSNVEVDTQMIVDTAGNIYMAGTTYSSDFPASPLPGSLLNSEIYRRDPDIYVTRLKPDASAIDWSFFIGGTAFERCAALTQDSLGNIYVFGSTSSVNFPVTPGAWKTSINSRLTDEFAVKLDAQTGLIEASTYLGLAASTNSLSLISSGPFAVDFTGGVYALGFAGPDFQPSANAYISKTPNTYQPSGIVRLNSSLTAAIYQTYFNDTSRILRPDSSGNLFLIPASNQTLISELNASGTAVTSTAQIGGISDMQFDSSGNLWVTGGAISKGFPSTNPLQLDPVSSNYSPSPSQTYPFFAEFPSGSQTPLQATLFYGPTFETQLASGSLPLKLLWPGGRLCLTGLPDNVHTPGAIVSPQGNSGSLACVDDSGTHLGLRTGLPSTDVYTAAQATPDGAVLFAGQAYSGLPTTPGVVQPVFGGEGVYSSYTVNGGDAFLLRVSLQNPLPTIKTISPDSLYVNQPNNPNTGGGWNFNINGSGFGYGTQLTWNAQAVTSTVQSSTQMTITALPVSTVQPGPNQMTASLPPPGGGVSNTVTITGLNPAPSTLTITPAQVTAGAGETKVVITGIGLLPSAVLSWNGSPRTATFVPAAGFTSAFLELLLEPSDLAQPSSVNISVTNPSPGGGVSPIARFVVQAASGTGVPSLAGPYLYRFDDSTPIPSTIKLTGTNFTASTVAYWDGAAIPSSFVSATQLNVNPPSSDLAGISSHDVYVANGSLQSATTRVQFSRTVTTSFLPNVFSAPDPARKLLYLLVAPNTLPRVYDLTVLDTVSGKQILSVTGIMTSISAAVLSDDGAYLYLGGGTSGAEIMRFNTASGSVDLDWQIPVSDLAPSTAITGIATVTHSPETIIVASSGGGALAQFSIYDRDQARPLAGTANFGCCTTTLFATENRVFLVGGATFPCLAWFDFDASGIESYSGNCGLQPPELIRRAGFAWLTDGSRTQFLSAPYGIANSGPYALYWLIDPVNNAAWSVTNSSALQLLRFDLASAQMTTPSRPGFSVNYGASLFLNNDGSLRILVVPGQLSAP